MPHAPCSSRTKRHINTQVLRQGYGLQWAIFKCPITNQKEVVLYIQEKNPSDKYIFVGWVLFMELLKVDLKQSYQLLRTS